MIVSDLRKRLKMSQREFADRFGIPIGTLRNWEQGISNPPDYVYQMIFTSMMRDKMINIETIKFVRLLDELASLSKNGIESFENANEATTREKIFYDTSELAEDGYKVVLDAEILDDPECYHHDIISYYDSDTMEYKVRAIVDEGEPAYITVTMLISGETIVVENGTWYFA